MENIIDINIRDLLISLNRISSSKTILDASQVQNMHKHISMIMMTARLESRRNEIKAFEGSCMLYNVF
jgi:hypothetical protein